MPHETDYATSLLQNARTVKTTLNYLDRSVTHPYNYTYLPPNGEPRDNIVNVETEVAITDLRSFTPEQRQKLGFVTDQAGFQVVEGFGKEDTQEGWQKEKWEDEEWIRQVYYADVDALLKREKGVTSTLIFDHTLRKRKVEIPGEALTEDSYTRTPVRRAHIDQSKRAGENRIIKHLGQETYDRVLRGEVRVQLINVWRPLRGPLFDTPLAYADFRSVEPTDLQPSELRYPTWTGETLAIFPNPSHRWYYLNGMNINEAVFLKCYDSAQDTKTPHTAFVDPSSPPDALPRWSIEIRLLAVTDLTLQTAPIVA